MGKIQLSGTNYIKEYGSTRVTVGNWSTEKSDYSFSFCQNRYCQNSADHEYAFDGQVFYKKRRVE